MSIKVTTNKSNLLHLINQGVNMSDQFDALNIADLMDEVERLDASKEGQGGFMDNFVRFPEKDGFVTVRLLPPAKNKKFYCATRTHRINGKSVHCPRELMTNKQGKKVWQDADPKKPCVICKYTRELWSESEKKPEAEAKELQAEYSKIKAIERYYYNCVARSQKNQKGEVETNVGPKILSVGKTIHDRIVRAITGDKANDEKPLGDVTDIKAGRDFKIIKKMKSGPKGTWPEYEAKFQDPSILGDRDQVEQWLGNMHDLSQLRKLISAEEMAIELKKHLGIIKDEEDAFDINEFKKPVGTTQSIEAQVRQETQRTAPPVAAQTPSPAKTDPVLSSGGGALSEEEFFDVMKNM